MSDDEKYEWLRFDSVEEGLIAIGKKIASLEQKFENRSEELIKRNTHVMKLVEWSHEQDDRIEKLEKERNWDVINAQWQSFQDQFPELEEDIATNMKELSSLKGVLRDFFEILHYSEYPAREMVDRSKEFLEKLDSAAGSARQTEDSPERVKQIKAMDRMIEIESGETSVKSEGSLRLSPKGSAPGVSDQHTDSQPEASHTAFEQRHFRYLYKDCGCAHCQAFRKIREKGYIGVDKEDLRKLEVGAMTKKQFLEKYLGGEQ